MIKHTYYSSLFGPKDFRNACQDISQQVESLVLANVVTFLLSIKKNHHQLRLRSIEELLIRDYPFPELKAFEVSANVYRADDVVLYRLYCIDDKIKQYIISNLGLYKAAYVPKVENDRDCINRFVFTTGIKLLGKVPLLDFISERR